MKYIVMECHLSYAILLDEEGRFVKAANLHYETGQTVTDIIEMKEPEPVRRVNYKLISGLATAAACFVLLLLTFLNNQTYASVFMVINPEVRIDVNRKNVVVDLEGVNEDGQDLIEGYSYKKKSLESVMDELVDCAIEMGYLSDGEQITLTLDAKDDDWIVTTGTELQNHIDEYLTDKMSIHIEISNPEVPDTTAPVQPENVVTEQPQTIVIPTAPDDGDSGYGESDYGDTSIDTDDGDSNYGEADDSSSNYDDGNSGYDNDDGFDDGDSNYVSSTPVVDSESDYEVPDTSVSDDSSSSNYDDSSSYGDSSYE